MNIQDHLKKMVDLFGELPDPIHQPKKFEYLVKAYWFITRNTR